MPERPGALGEASMKKLTIFYWITTGLVLFFFVPGAIMNVMKTPDWVEVFQQLGYPEYLLPFLGVAKLLGCLVVVLPQFRRLKDRKSTRLNSSHVKISYAVFCLKK